MRKSYDHERLSVEQRNVAIETQNVRILLQKAEVEKLNLEKDRLFSIVAHDVRMPLSSIQGYLEILNGIGLDEEEKQEIAANASDKEFTMPVIAVLQSFI